MNESGNVLFLILIAVMLFAALSFAIGSGRSSSKDGTGESQTIRASQITQYGLYMEQSVMKMRLGGLRDVDYCFDADGWDHNDYDHPGCAEIKNQVFLSHEDAGNVTWSEPPPGASINNSPWYITGNVCIPGAGRYTGDDCNSDGTGDSEDLVLILPDISRELCLALNERFGHENPGGEPPKDSGNAYDPSLPKFSGTYADGEAIDSASSDPLIMRFQPYGCVEAPTGSYMYFHLLLAR